ncbi:MAG: T9SS type A sorting domain-containing protein [candidate division WOR-3 bacterium]|nr:MAG: T9SS type A sorting domain-containing protein [candidate division WOR-3 bacterium]
MIHYISSLHKRTGYHIIGMLITCCLIMLTPMWAQWPGVHENLAVCDDPSDQYIPQIVRDGNDGCIIIWYDARNGMDHINVYGQRVSADGEELWTQGGLQLTDTPSYTWVSYLFMCADGAGGAYFAWQDPREGNHNIYVQRIDSTGTPYWAANGIQVSSTSQDDFINGVIPDGSGGCIVAWNEWTTHEAIQCQRLNAAGDKLWGTFGVEVSEGTDFATNSTILSDGCGGIIACWLDGRYWPNWNDFKDIYAQRVDSLGQLCWADTGICVVGLGSVPFSFFPRMVSNNAERYYIAWQDWRNNSHDIYAQGLSQEGEISWTVNGTAVCDTVLDQVSPQILMFDEQRIFCAWRDYYDYIYAQLLDDEANHLWQYGGVLVASGDNELQLMDAVQLSSGDMAVVYTEQLPGVSDEYIKAQALDTMGTCLWDTSNMYVSSVVSGKSRVRMIADSCGGIIAVWQDYRNAAYVADIFAQRVDPDVAVEENDYDRVSSTFLTLIPNPCADRLIIRFSNQTNENTSVAVYDIAGCLVKTLYRGASGSGMLELVWDLKSDAGSPVPNGIYFVRAWNGIQQEAINKVTVVR